MNERERAILRGKSITPQTEDEAALKYAVENGGGGGKLVEIDLSGESSGITWDDTDQGFTADDTVDGEPIYNALSAGRPVWIVYGTPQTQPYHGLVTRWLVDNGYLWLWGWDNTSPEVFVRFANYGPDDPDHTLPVHDNPLSVILPKEGN